MEHTNRPIFALFLSLILMPVLAFAAPTLPDAKVWISPADAEPTKPVTLHAFVYNTSKEEITFTVSFKEKTTEVASTAILVPAESAKVATATWIMPSESKAIAAVVTKATTKQNKDIATLHGTLGTVTVGSIATLPEISIPGGSTVKAWVGGFLEKAEVFRVRNAGYFVREREAAKVRLGINTFGGVADKLLTPEIPAQDPKDAEVAPVESKNDPMDYVTLAYSSILAPLFAQKAVFYIVSILLTLFIIRFIVSRFF